MSHELALGLPPKREGYARAAEISSLLSEVQGLIHSFFEAADDDAEALAEGHGLQVSGGGPRTVLVEHHAPPKLASLMNLSVFSKEPGAKDLMSAVSDILKYSVNTSSPGFMDKLYSSPSPPGIAADLLISSLNTNVHVYGCSPALTLIEKHVGKELASLFGLSGTQAGGVTVPGGASGNTTAMLIARNVRFPAIKEEGIAAVPKRLAVFTSDAAHYSISTAAQSVGLGSKSVHKVSSTNESMDPGALEASIQDSIKAGQVPFFISATSGTTVRGAYDDLQAIGEIAKKYNAWFHVDACWGGGAVFSSKLRHKLKGSGLADSVTFNPHKMLGVPTTTSFLLGRDLRTFWAANRLEAGYLFHNDAEDAQVDAAKPMADLNLKDGRRETEDNPNWRSSPWVLSAPQVNSVYDLAQFLPACGRRPDALKLYMHWRYYGTEGIAKHVEASFAGARKILQLVKASPVLTIVGNDEPPCAQACFYYSGEGGKIGMRKDITRGIVQKLLNRGWMTDYAPGKIKDEEYLRVVCHRLTTGPMAEGLVKAVVAAGAEVEEELSR